METKLGNTVLDHKVSAELFSRIVEPAFPMERVSNTQWSMSNRILTANIQIYYLSLKIRLTVSMCVGNNSVTDLGFSWLRFHTLLRVRWRRPFVWTSASDLPPRQTCLSAMQHAGGEAIWMQRTFQHTFSSSLTLRPNAGHALLTHEVSRTHTTHHSR